MNTFNTALGVLSDFLHRDYSMYYNTVKKELFALFSKYELKFGALRLSRPTQRSASAKNVVSSWNRFRPCASDTPVTSNVTVTAPVSGPAISELSSYLDSDCIVDFDESFSILGWWEAHKRTYPILSVLAKDIMIVSVSTVSSESAFSLTGRLIEERRRSLTSEHVEMLSLIKDWEQAARRQQHDVENRDLEEKMANLFLDHPGVPEPDPEDGAAGAGGTTAEGSGVDC